ncbi:hypothetical protein E2C01_062782 [Portunus trituberculatus]|uniref:Uncharacterized protein n=1 Tax=Portunus trituberculatus TaxID=210409 RepID=A0A5B7H8V3_PORTR|nr:hypothetical protein [Portunus trituberculatus]
MTHSISSPCAPLDVTAGGEGLTSTQGNSKQNTFSAQHSILGRAPNLCTECCAAPSSPSQHITALKE